MPKTDDIPSPCPTCGRVDEALSYKAIIFMICALLGVALGLLKVAAIAMGCCVIWSAVFEGLVGLLIILSPVVVLMVAFVMAINFACRN
ncbi:hypothetical protein Dalk_4567 [Desulfatibacillum aliphaticivorans]|uniref:Transmembrane protein n=1 Tax=Desulfatibacillum aliphaticivorans TaxID=218208 RepID=B8FNG4_DESAL|nr:hypothetical protein [Desulfatibacillum aliphaticivorans]ACL06245.1 hypothetical protein Dalk_4567 [Desulfatibacillum aliphaticivorans]